MKMLSLIALAILSFSVHAENDPTKKVYELVKINWEQKYLEHSVVLQCDDSYAFGVDIELPGEFKFPDLYMSYVDCGVDWRQLSKQVVTDNAGNKSTRVRFDGGSSCTIKVREKVKPPAKPKIFIVEISDAC